MKNILNANRKFSSREYYTILYYTILYYTILYYTNILNFLLVSIYSKKRIFSIKLNKSWSYYAF